MKSPTHFLIGHCCARVLRWRGRDARLLILGACLPDIPIILCWPAIGLYTVITGGAFDSVRFKSIADGLYFSDSVLSGFHNLLHSPVSLGFLFLAAGIVFPAHAVWRRAAMIILAGALSHSLVDIASHVEDGPLVFWPLENTIRITGPVSHWNPAYGGFWITGIEIGGAIAVVVWQVVRRFRIPRISSAPRPATRYARPGDNVAGAGRPPGVMSAWTKTVLP